MTEVSEARAADMSLSTEAESGSLSAAARARMERNRLRARALQDARLVRRGPAATDNGSVRAAAAAAVSVPAGGARALDSGGGFLLEEPPSQAPPRAAPRPAPLVHTSEQPHCLRCELPFPQSYLFDTFDYELCDVCREAATESDEELELVTRTEAKSEFLLQDCDLDKREPALRAVRRRNPHRPGGADMRLYLRAQLRARAHEVWGGALQLDEERARREERRLKTRSRQSERRVRALRRDVRSALFVKTRAAHEHRWGPERALPADPDTYTRVCLECGHEETYEKM